ncbi:MAG: PD-(D/E)XK nuclease family protein [Elusimicrobia bacterium]|nr:PD-(D/E)XK nuclease family protein [Elusimicrobiota bacterium]MDD7502277.1 PD-(D/E)XK nuclease family protein [Elusimicrobiota bacterium]MDY5729277.1 PD-(D/E)XK nuclease family protein [Elusimicrobiaceae bacterium]
MARNLSFSYSKMGMYKECPQKYKFRYVHMLPEQPKYYFAFGSALHEVMEYIYNPATPAFPTLAQALQFFEQHWNKTSWEQKGYASAEKELAGYAEGRRIIETYYAKNAATFAHPLSVEMKSTLEIDGLSLISILDRMDYLGDGKIKILDYKTGKTVQREPDQLYMYQKVAENSPAIKALVQQKDPGVKQIRVEQLSFYHLPTLHEMMFERAADKEIFEFWQGVLKVADNIRAGKFDPTPGENQCRWCDYRNICPVFTGKEYTGPAGFAARKTAVPAPAALPKSETDVLSEKIDRCGELLDEAKALQKEIISLMRKNNFERHFGARYKAELARVEKLEFTDKEKVVELLRTLKLLAKVLVPTQSTVAGLLTDSSVPSEAKEKLAAFARKSADEKLSLEKVD